MKNHNAKVCLVQIRIKEDILNEEATSFVDATGLQTDQVLVVNPILKGLDHSLLNEVDAVLIGGSGAYSVTKDYDWTQDLHSFVSAIIDRGVPCFGSCWGHQFLARVLGGEVINDESRAEMGTHEVFLTSNGKEDSLLSTLPDFFLAQMGHQDRVSVLPSTCVELANSKIAPYQSFKVKDKPVYGTQFHPELSAANEKKRLEAYRDAYPAMKESDTFQTVYDNVRDTPEVSQLLKSFIELSISGGLN